MGSLTIARERFGTTPEGRRVDRFIVRSSHGFSLEAITYGCILVALRMPDRTGKVANVVLGFDTLEEYLADSEYIGALIGRFANRISQGRFSLDGTEYTLARNYGSLHVHGGLRGYNSLVWEAEEFQGEGRAGIRFHHVSPDGDEGYPGRLEIEAVYSLSEDDELSFEYTAKTDAPTPANLTNHAYWNLAGAGSGDIKAHVLELRCPFYLPTDEAGTPTGEVLSVTGTPMDFTKPKAIGLDMGKLKEGYDHCYVAGPDRQRLKTIARVHDPASGRGMEVLTTKPGVQLYTSNELGSIRGAEGARFERHGALCLETQFFPDSVNRPHFPSCILRPGETYHHSTRHRFFLDQVDRSRNGQ